MKKIAYIFSGAFDSGKTTTLQYLKENYGYNFHHEAHNSVLNELGERTFGHNPIKYFETIEKKNHLCPMCTPIDFFNLAIQKQWGIEASLSDGEFIERSQIDIVEHCERNTEVNSIFKLKKLVTYKKVFIFEVMPKLQQPRWGKTKEKRITQAKEITKSLIKIYQRYGIPYILIGPGSVKERALFVKKNL